MVLEGKTILISGVGPGLGRHELEDRRPVLAAQGLQVVIDPGQRGDASVQVEI